MRGAPSIEGGFALLRIDAVMIPPRVVALTHRVKRRTWRAYNTVEAGSVRTTQSMQKRRAQHVDP